MSHRVSIELQYCMIAVLFVVCASACANRGSVSVGGQCRRDESCITGVCLREVRSAGAVSWLAGYCSGHCSTENACPEGSCVFLADGLQYCLSHCEGATDCRDGYVCSKSISACVPDCRLGWNCDTLTCGATGECELAATKPVGAACALNAECLSGLCIPEQKQDAGVAWTSGSCSLECPTRTECPTSSTCVPLEDGSSYCASVCAADTDCRSGYVCAVAVGACLPDCRLGWSCGATLVCSASGECLDPLAGDAGVPSDAASGAADGQTRGSDAGGRGPGPGPGGVWN